MARGPAHLEDRLRKWVRRRVEERGEKAALARALKKDPAWVTGYLEGIRHPDIDVTVAIMKHYTLDVAAVIGERPLPVPNAVTQRLNLVWQHATDKQQGMILDMLEGLLTPEQRQAVQQHIASREAEERARGRGTPKRKRDANA